ncbi:MAG TPA: RNA 2',3'-cyclic phosphodiesterase [Holophagaceae bacterium]|jgi:2'-5' RNA ligase|nr:RNA 2',3'-cyclic phosphodiesterase [Holophagaceae bacterium]
MRLFFALDLPGAVKARLEAWQRTQGGIWRWAPLESLHLTLAFLGETGETQVLAARRIGAVVAARHGPFALRAKGLGGFPRDEAARVLWLGCEPSAHVEALSTDLRRELASADLSFDAKPFKAHVTLARSPRTQLTAPFGLPTGELGWEVRALALMRSEGGGRYAAVAYWLLG